MINAQLLDKKIEESGLKTIFIVNKLGLSKSGFYKKKSGISPFRSAEIYLLSELLKLDDSEKQSIFFE